MKKLLIIISMLMIALAAWVLAGRYYAGSRDVEKLVVERDTVVVVDTVIQVAPVAVEHRSIGKRELRVGGDEIMSPRTEVNTDDSLTVSVDAKQVVYQGEDYRAVVSGVSVRLDTIVVYPRHEVITVRERVPPKRWHVGPMVGVGVSGSGKVEVVAGVSVSYSFYSW